MNPIDAISGNALNRLRAEQAARVAPNAAARPVAGNSAGSAAPAHSAQAPLAATPSVTTRALAGSEPPVDTDRVAMIRKAVEQGNYPVMPARIADAMIAAGYLLRNAK